MHVKTKGLVPLRSGGAIPFVRNSSAGPCRLHSKMLRCGWGGLGVLVDDDVFNDGERCHHTTPVEVEDADFGVACQSVAMGQSVVSLDS